MSAADWSEARRLHLAKGMAIKAIACATGVLGERGPSAAAKRLATDLPADAEGV